MAGVEKAVAVPVIDADLTQPLMEVVAPANLPEVSRMLVVVPFEYWTVPL